MPEYLAPGVYIEEVSFRTKTIEGVSTSTAGFVGPTRYGPTAGEPELLTSFADFERIYGGLDQLVLVDNGNETVAHNYVAHAVRGFFEQGGKRLYVARVYGGTGGRATSTAVTNVTLTARFPGRAGNMRLTLLPRLSDNLLVTEPIANAPQVRRIQEHDTVIITTTGTPTLYDVVRVNDQLLFRRPGTGGTPQDQAIASLNPTDNKVYLLTVDVAIERPLNRTKRPRERFELPQVLEGFALHPQHARSLTAYFAEEPVSRRLALTVPFFLDPADTLNTGVAIAEALLGSSVIGALVSTSATQENRQRVLLLSGGSDGTLPAADDYRGVSDATVKEGLAALADLEDISIVAAPGYSADYTGGNVTRVNTIQAHLITHAEQMRYRVAVLDAPNDQTVGQVREYRGKVDSTHAALYYPWIRILDPVTEEEIIQPPSGFVAGIYARSDVEEGGHKAPTNEVVRLAVGFEFLLNKAQQDVLNPEGINCLRFFVGRGYRLWGARTVSSDPEWKYVNVRRYFAYLERSIDKGTQWAVFENNGDRLWTNIRITIEDFLFNEWRSGRLLGTKPQEAYFVRCDRTTMTQNDIDNGRLICLIGVAPLRPAEFVIFRIGQWTADRRA